MLLNTVIINIMINGKMLPLFLSCFYFTIRTTLTEDYFLSESLCSPYEELDNVHSIPLIVASFNAKRAESDLVPSTTKKARTVKDTNDSPIEKALELLNAAQNWILDIDLDFFSTANPFCNAFSEV